MKCSQCGSENSVDAKFCTECSASLTNRCSRCGKENDLNSKFCGECGADLVDSQRQPDLASTSDIPKMRPPLVAPKAEDPKLSIFSSPNLEGLAGADGANKAITGRERTITSADIIAEMSIGCGVSVTDASLFIDGFWGYVLPGKVSGGRVGWDFQDTGRWTVVIPGFGTFITSRHVQPSRELENPYRPGELMSVASREIKKVRFRSRIRPGGESRPQSTSPPKPRMTLAEKLLKGRQKEDTVAVVPDEPITPIDTELVSPRDLNLSRGKNSHRWARPMLEEKVSLTDLSMKRRMIWFISGSTGLEVPIVAHMFEYFLALLLFVFDQGNTTIRWARRGNMFPCPAYRGRNPSTGEALVAPAGRYYRFRPYAGLRQSI